MTNERKLPKSLHTVTVLQELAYCFYAGGLSRADAMNKALDVLGYLSCPDPYGLVEKGRKALDKYISEQEERDADRVA